MDYTYNYLSTFFKDDIINTEINGRRKYRMIQNDDDTVSFEDVTNYLKKGDFFGGNNINDANEQINNINYELKNVIYKNSKNSAIFNADLPDNSVKYLVVFYFEYNDTLGQSVSHLEKNEEITESKFKIDLEPNKGYEFELQIQTNYEMGIIGLQPKRIDVMRGINWHARRRDDDTISLYVYNGSSDVYKNFSVVDLFDYIAARYDKLVSYRD